MTSPARLRAGRHVLVALAAVGLVAASTVAVVIVREPRRDDASVTTPAAGPGACSPAAQPPPDTSGATPPPPARVAIPGAVEVDLGELVVTELVAGEGDAWASVVEPDGDPVAGRLAQIDGASGTVVTTVPIVDGCTISALAMGDGSVWVGTCDELAASGAAGGGLVIEVDPAVGAVVGEVALPVSCVDEVTAGGGSVSATSAALAGETTRIWRVDPEAGAATEIDQLDEAAPGGIALTDDGLWVQELSEDGDEAVRSDPETGQDEVSVPEEGAVLVGNTDDAVWFQRPDAVVQRDASTGAVRTETPLTDVQTVAVGASGVWYQQATPGSVTITIGRIDPATGTVDHTFQFDGVGLDRSGLPFTVRLAVDDTGVWVVYQGRVYRSLAPVAPEPDPAPETSEPPPSTTEPDTTTTASVPPPSSTAVPSTTVPATTASDG